jgi:hypothetical protein
MKLCTLAIALAALLAAGCDRNTTTTPSPKTDTSSVVPQAAAGSSATPANAGAPSTSEKREGSNPTQGQVDPKHASQQRDFQSNEDGNGPRSSDTQPTTRN